MYDIAIIGAGPAGSTLARLIGNKYKVLLVDKRGLDIYPEKCSAVKCCGGLVAPDAQKVLAEMGLGLPKRVLVGPQLFTVRTIDFQNSIERYYQRFYINIDRERFDRWLVSLLPDGVDVCFESIFKAYEKENDGFKITIHQNGKDIYKKARLLVGADGANSMLRKLAFSNILAPEKYVSIQEWYESDTQLPYFSAIFDSEVTDFYSWTIPKENHVIIGAAISLKDNAQLKFNLLKQKLTRYGMEFGKLAKKEGAFILRPRSINQIFAGSDDVALLGEAAGFISPSSAEGLSYAFRSAIALANSLLEAENGFIERYMRNTQGLKSNIFIKNLKSPFMYNPWIRKKVMQSGIQSIDVQNTNFGK